MLIFISIQLSFAGYFAKVVFQQNAIKKEKFLVSP